MNSPVPTFDTLPGMPQWLHAHLESVGSTNALMLEWSRDRDLDRCWLTAGEQTAGRGRRARNWSSPKGNLYASLLLVDPAPRETLGVLPLVAAIAVRDAVASLLPQTAPTPRLKWPNDVLIGGAKCSGILLENEWRKDGSVALVIGCGLNLVAHPEDTPYPATALAKHGANAEIGEAFNALASAFSDALALFAGGNGIPAIRERWSALAHEPGETLVVNLPGETLQGRFEAIDPEGRLLLRLADGAQKTISAGDVFFGAPPHEN